MSSSKFVKPEVKEPGKEAKHKCDLCKKPFTSKGNLSKHVNNSCPEREYEQAECQFCGRKMTPAHLRDHVKKFHPERLEEFEVMTMEMTAENQELSKMISEMGDRGGQREVRAGCEFLFDKENLLIRYSIEEVDSSCIGTPREVKTFHWKTDKYLPNALRLNADQLPLGYPGWHFGHVVCYTYHRFDEKRKATVTASSVGCVQHQSLNQGAWKDLESSFKFLSLKYRTFIWSGTIMSDPPITREAKGRRDKKFIVKKPVGVPEYLFKIAVVKDEESGWRYDPYLIKNDGSSTMSPNAYRTDLETIRERSGFTFLANLQTLQPADLWSEGNTLKWQWKRENPNRYDADIDDTHSVAESGFDDDAGLSSASDVDDVLSQGDPKDIQIQQLKAEVASLKDRNVEIEAEKATLKAEKATLKEENAEMKAEIVKLRAQLGHDGNINAKRRRRN